MDCREVKSKLLEAAEGELRGQERAAVEEHLGHCPDCTAELKRLEAAVGAMHEAVELLAPRRAYLTPERLARLTEVLDRRRPKVQLITLRRFVASAAAAAILVALYYLAGDVAILLRQTEESPIVVQRRVRPSAAQVVLGSVGQDEPVRVVRSFPVAAESGAVGEATRREPADLQAPRWVETDSPGLIVPVDHAFYDPEESSHWW